MNPRITILPNPAILFALLFMVLAALIPTSSVSAAPLNQIVETVKVTVVTDIGVINGIDVDIPEAEILIFENRPSGLFDHNFLSFDLPPIPADAVVTEAYLELYMNRIALPGQSDHHNVELGVVEEEWPLIPFRWDEQPLVRWSGRGQQISELGPATWPMKPIVTAWLNGSVENNGIALRGTIAGGVLEAQSSDDKNDDPLTDADGFGPQLVISYTRPARLDLGDAPDSSNHFGVPMQAYPGVMANFPTVFDPATGLPIGPRHLRPQLFHLGPDVSIEAEADQGADSDGVNNIDPPANVANQDLFDNGSLLTLTGQCQPALADVEVTVSPKALAEFSSTDPYAYLNIWLDWSYDGDWDDLFICTGPGGQSETALEHILIDYPIDVTTLVTGTNILPTITTGRVPWPPQYAQNPRWVRFTLSRVPSNKALSYTTGSSIPTIYGDGRGVAPLFQWGETEDYLMDLGPMGDDDTQADTD